MHHVKLKRNSRFHAKKKGWVYHAMLHFHAITPIILLFHESRPEKKTNHAITPSGRGASLKATGRTKVLLKTVITIFRRALHLRDRHFFMWQKYGNFGRFQYFNFEKDFWKLQTFLKKLEYHFLIKSTIIQSAIFPHKTALSEANGNTNRMGSTKWTYHKERSFTSNCFIFLKIFFQFKNLL